MKKAKVLCLILSLAVMISSISLFQIDNKETKAESTTEVIFSKGSDGWAYKLNVTETAIPAGGFTIDGTWKTGSKMPIGYGSKTPSSTYLAGGTVLNPGSPINCGNVAMQKTVTINDLSKFGAFSIDADVDDGAVIFVNGKEAALMNAKKVDDADARNVVGYRRDGVVGTPFVDNLDRSVFTNVTISKDLFVTGTNVITMVISNDTVGSSDIYADMSLAGLFASNVDNTPSGTSIKRGDEWLWEKNGAGTAWLEENFAPAMTWTKNASPIGYGYEGVSNVASGNCTNVYLRRILVIDDMSKVNTVKMHLWLDDSATVYFNGVQAAPTFNAGGTIDKTQYDTGKLKVLTNGLKQGINIISVNLINATATSSDLYFDMTLETSEDDIGFQGNKFVMTYGKDETQMGFSWYSPYTRDESDIYFVPNTADETKYSTQLQGLINGEGGRYHDGTAKSIYKLPLDKSNPKATMVIDISQNYTVEFSGDGTTWGDLYADASLKDAAECGGNRHKAEFDLSKYISAGYNDLYVRIGDQTTTNGWGAIVFSITLVAGDYPPASISGSALKLVKKSQLVNGQMPSGATVIDGVSRIVDGDYMTNQVNITDLEANTEYAYIYGNKYTDKWSEVYTFMTQSGGNEFKALFIGDPQIGGSGNDVSDGVGFDDNLDKALTFLPDAAFILSAGDQVDHIRESEYDALLSADKLKNYAFIPTYGNHDANDPNFQNHYNLPNMTAQAKTSSGGDYYLSYGNTLIMVLNANNTNVAEHKVAMQEAVASHTDAKWKLILMHHDMYGAGQHAAKTSMTDSTATIKLRQTLAPIFEELGVDVVLNGHDHTYARSYFMKDQQVQADQVVDEDGAYVLPKGIVYITASCSSTAKFYSLVGNPDYVAKKTEINEPQFSTLEITDSSFEIVIYRSDTMEVIDELKIKKDAAADTLNDLIADAEELKAEDYTTATFEALQTALSAAKQTASLSNPTQDQINTAYKALTEAINKLVSKEGLKTSIEEQITEAEKLLTEAKVGTGKGEYSQADVDTFTLKVNKYKALLENASATSEQLEEALAEIKTAMESFKGKANQSGIEEPGPIETTDPIPAPNTGDANVLGAIALVGISTAAHISFKTVAKRKED